MRAFQLLCVSLVAVASVSGAAPPPGGFRGFCTGIHTTSSKSCDLYDEAECLNAKELGCFWEAATGGSSTGDTAPSPKMDGGAGEKEAPSPGGSPADDTKWDAAPSPKMEGGAGDAKGYCTFIKGYTDGPGDCASFSKVVCSGLGALERIGFGLNYCKWIEPAKGEG